MTKGDGLPKYRTVLHGGVTCLGCPIVLSKGDWGTYHYDRKGFFCVTCAPPAHLVTPSSRQHFVVDPDLGPSQVKREWEQVVKLDGGEERCQRCEGRMLKGVWGWYIKHEGYVCEYCKPFCEGEGDPRRPL